MRRDPDIIRRERPIKPRNPLLLRHLPKTVHHPTIWQFTIWSLGLFLQSCFHKIKRQTHRRGKESRNRGSCQSLRFGSHIGALETGLGFGEECQLTEIERHGANDGWGCAGPETNDTFVFDDSSECREDGGVVFALCQWLQTICQGVSCALPPPPASSVFPILS